MSKDETAASDAQTEGSPSFEGVIIEDSTSDGDDAGGDGLELDAQQAAEIRQIFLTSLPDYLVPIKEMIAKLGVEPDESGEIKAGLAKTIAQIAAAAARMKLDDIMTSMEALRDDVLLFDAAEQQDALRERIHGAITALDGLAQRAATSVRPEKAPSETLVAALKGVDEVDNATLQKLMAAGVVYVDQVLGAEQKEVAMVSGLDAATVAKLFRLLEAGRPGAARTRAGRAEADYAARLLGDVDDIVEASPRVSSLPLGAGIPKLPSLAPAVDLLGLLDAKDRQSAPPRQPRRTSEPDATGGERHDARASTLRRRVEDELALEEARGEVTRLQAAIRTLRRELTMGERDCADLRSAIADARALAVKRVTSVAKLEMRRVALDRQRADADAELEAVTRKLRALEAERRAVLDQLGHLTQDTASLSREITGHFPRGARSGA